MNLPRLKCSIAGFDVGLSGGFVINYSDRTNLTAERFVISPYDIERFAIHLSDVKYVVAENVHAFGDQGSVSTGTLMEQKGELKGMCRILNIPIVWIEPLAWIKCYTMKRTKHFASKRLWKKHLAEIAKELVPDSLVNEITIETADAFLIWHYAARIEAGDPMKPKGTFVFNERPMPNPVQS